MTNTKDIDRLNALLAQELGRTPSGEGKFTWQWSERLTHQMREINRSTGQPVYDYRCQCGTNVMVHAAECTLTVPVPRWITRPLCPQLHEQWVVLVWCDPGTPDQWEKEFGGKMQYPVNGYRVPTNVCLQYGAEPDKAVTWDFIHLWRKERKKSFKDWEQEAEDALALQERRNDSRLDAQIGDACTAFGHAKPGTRSGGISFPGRG